VGTWENTKMMTLRHIRPFVALVAIAAALVFATAADARIGGGLGAGSRGSRTFSAPPPTTTAPSARPLERTVTQPTRPSLNPSPSSPGFFGRPGFFGTGLFGGLLGGFLGAGLFGMLFGHGMFGGMGGFSSIFGLLIQAALIFFVARLVWGWWQRRHAPALAGASSMFSPGPTAGFGGGAGFGLGGSSQAQPEPAGTPITIGQQDFDTFERLLGEIQAAYGSEDIAALRSRLTPEMVSYMADDLAKNASRGVVNRVSDVKLLQGDLSEAWREGDVEYASVAMRFSAIDKLVDRATGRVVEGDATHPVEATEVWTFRRDRGGNWLLSAIQQV
jgi:predicted lipid-binding transport protein (Tim44 family)